MDPADLLDYALGKLEGPRREQIERRIARDPALAERMARLMRNLVQLLDDGRGGHPPGESPGPPPPTGVAHPDLPRPARRADRPRSDSR